MVVGLVSIAFFDTAGLITLSALGAATLYVVAMLAMIALRRREPELPRPYRAPGGLTLPVLALGLAGLALLTMLHQNFNASPATGPFQRWLSLWYLLTLAAAGAWYALAIPQKGASGHGR
jgi:ethanolamine permease